MVHLPEDSCQKLIEYDGKKEFPINNRNLIKDVKSNCGSVRELSLAERKTFPTHSIVVISTELANTDALVHTMNSDLSNSGENNSLALSHPEPYTQEDGYNGNLSMLSSNSGPEAVPEAEPLNSNITSGETLALRFPCSDSVSSSSSASSSIARPGDHNFNTIENIDTEMSDIFNSSQNFCESNITEQSKTLGVSCQHEKEEKTDEIQSVNTDKESKESEPNSAWSNVCPPDAAQCVEHVGRHPGSPTLLFTQTDPEDSEEYNELILNEQNDIYDETELNYDGLNLSFKPANQHALKAGGAKRVSFGDSKGVTMVETLVYEANSLRNSETFSKQQSTSSRVDKPGHSKHAFKVKAQDLEKPTQDKDEAQSSAAGESRPPSRVRVTFFESEKPVAVSSPESEIVDFDLSKMTLSSSPTIADRSPNSYNKQISNEGWDNPFRPDGNLSKEADQIVELIKEGKPINDETLRSISPSLNETIDSVASASNIQVQASSRKGGEKEPNGAFNGKSGGSVEVQRKIIEPAGQPFQVEHVNLKKKNKGCCSVQ